MRYISLEEKVRCYNYSVKQHLFEILLLKKYLKQPCKNKDSVNLHCLCLHGFSSEESAFGGSPHDTEVIRGCTSALRMASGYPRVIETNNTPLG